MNVNDISDYTGKADPSLLIPRIGTSYKEKDAFKEIVDHLKKWQFKTALNKLDRLIEIEVEPVDALLLKGEILAHFDLNQDAAEQFKLVLERDSENIFAEMMLIIQLAAMKSEAELEEYTTRLKERSPEMFELYERITILIEENHNRFEFPGITDPIEAICVFGYIVNGDGTLPEVLINRLKKVKELAELHPSAMILLSGGAVRNQFNEAVEMKKYLMEQGVAEQRIVSLEHAKDTVGNVIEFVDHIQTKEYKHICAVTSKVHLPRAWMTLAIALERIGYETCLSGTSPDEEIDEQMMELELQLNYQTLFRIAGLFEKQDITDFIIKEESKREFI